MLQPHDVQRLIQIIVEELAAAQTPQPARCACHSLMFECCPDRLAVVLEAGATRIGVHATGGAAGEVASMIDHTLLKPDATRKEIETLCREAAEYRFATVCVNPTWVALCATSARAAGPSSDAALGAGLSPSACRAWVARGKASSTVRSSAPVG